MDGVRYCLSWGFVFVLDEVVISFLPSSVPYYAAWVVRFVVWATVTAVLLRDRGGMPSGSQLPAGLVQIAGPSQDSGTDRPDDVTNVLVVVNPKSGARRAGSIVKQDLLPALKSTGRSFALNVCYTTSAEHVTELGRTHDPTAVPVVAIASGDGLFHDWVNGVRERGNARACLAATTFAFLPAGTGNGMATTCGGAKADAAAACMAGARTGPLDLMLITWLAASADAASRTDTERVPPGVPTATVPLHEASLLAGMSISMGGIAYHDELTERDLRWIGPLRLGIAPLLCLAFRPAPRLRVWWRHVTTVAGKRPTINADGWVCVEDNFTILEIITAPWIAHDAFIAPARRLGDGCLDLILVGNLSRLALARLLIGLETGKHVDMPGLEYHKASEVVVEVLEPGYSIVADGNIVATSRSFHVSCAAKATNAFIGANVDVFDP